MARQRRRVERSTNGSITSTNPTTGLRSSTIPRNQNLARIERMYGANGTNVLQNRLTVRNRKITRISGS